MPIETCHADFAGKLFDFFRLNHIKLYRMNCDCVGLVLTKDANLCGAIKNNDGSVTM